MPTGESQVERSRLLRLHVDVPPIAPDKVYGEVGVLDDDGDHLRCHICGEWFRSLGSHIWQAHGTTAAQYKAAFGLEQGTPLKSADILEKHRNDAIRRRLGDIGRAQIKHHPGARRRFPVSEAERIKRRTEVGPKISQVLYKRARDTGHRVEVGCPYCGKRFETWASYRNRYCSQECWGKDRRRRVKQAMNQPHVRERKRELTKDPNHPIHSPESRAKMRESRKGPTFTFTCECCGESSERPVWEKGRRFCSRDCSSQGRRKEASHGTMTMYRRRCRCVLCRAANKLYHRHYKEHGYYPIAPQP